MRFFNSEIAEKFGTNNFAKISNPIAPMLNRIAAIEIELACTPLNSRDVAEVAKSKAATKVASTALLRVCIN